MLPNIPGTPVSGVPAMGPGHMSEQMEDQMRGDSLHKFMDFSRWQMNIGMAESEKLL